MKKISKWIGIILGGLLGLILLAVLGLYAKSSMEFSKTYDVPVETVMISTDAESIEHGKHLAAFLCAECHGDDLGGSPNWIVLPNIAVISPPNITPGQGSVTADFTDEDWIRVLRHGVKRDGTSVFIMRAMDFYYLSDNDFGDLLAYLKSTPAVDRNDHNPTGAYELTFLGNIAYGAGAFGNLLAADRIDHDSRLSSYPEPAVTAEYGEYLVNINGCRGCHGADLAGARPGDPESTLAPNLTPGGELAEWTDTDFIQALRTGILPSGEGIIAKFMPWPYKGRMTDDELAAIFLYLQSLPSLPTSTALAE